MKIFDLVICSLSIIFFCNNAFCQNSQPEVTWNRNNDSIESKIDSIISSYRQNPNLTVITATDYDPSIREGMYGFYVFDTLTKQVQQATLYSFQGNIKKLINYYFFEEKLVLLEETNVPVNNQTSNRFRKLNRHAYYWNDKLIIHRGKDQFNHDEDLKKAREISARFKSRFSSGNLVISK